MKEEIDQGGIPFLRAPSGFRPKQDRAIPARSVTCPTCGQPAGQACISVGGNGGRGHTGKTTSTHPTRRRMALRALRDKTS